MFTALKCLFVKHNSDNGLREWPPLGLPPASSPWLVLLPHSVWPGGQGEEQEQGQAKNQMQELSRSGKNQHPLGLRIHPSIPDTVHGGKIPLDVLETML